MCRHTCKCIKHDKLIFFFSSGRNTMSNCLPRIVVFAAWSEFDDSCRPIWRNFLLLWNGAAGNGHRTSSKCYKRLNWSRVCLASLSRSLGFDCARLEPRDGHRIGLPSGPCIGRTAKLVRQMYVEASRKNRGSVMLQSNNEASDSHVAVVSWQTSGVWVMCDQ